MEAIVSNPSAGVEPGDGCLTCASPDVDEINEMLSRVPPVPARQIAKRFGLGKDSVNRHAFKRHPGVVVPDARPPVRDLDVPRAGLDDRTELQKLETQREALERALERNARADTSRELRQVNQRIGEIRGDHQAKTVTLADVEGLREQVRRWFEALEPFPDARDAMAAATDPTLMPDADVEA